MPDDILYSVKDLTVEYETRAGPVRAVDDVSLDIRRGEILGLVGESGCGKSTFGKALMRLHTGPARITNGELWFDGRDLMKLSEREMPDVRGAEIGMVFQDPMTSLNPVQRIVDHLTETVQTHEPETSEAAARARAADLVERLGIRRDRLNEYPHQMSGGMRQRLQIARNLVSHPRLVFMDEPTGGLDPRSRRDLIHLLKELPLTMLVSTHDMLLVAEIFPRMVILDEGQLVADGPTLTLMNDPALLESHGLEKPYKSEK